MRQSKCDYPRLSAHDPARRETRRSSTHNQIQLIDRRPILSLPDRARGSIVVHAQTVQARDEVVEDRTDAVAAIDASCGTLIEKRHGRRASALTDRHEREPGDLGLAPVPGRRGQEGGEEDVWGEVGR
jgi:hypothetical protein